MQRARVASVRPELGAEGSARSEKASVLAERMLLLVGWGIISPNTAQWLCAGAVEDGHAHNDVVTISSWGTSGKFAGNCRRDMLRRLPMTRLMPRPLCLDVHVSTKRKNIEIVPQSMLSPLHAMESISLAFPSQFERLFVQTPPKEFWDKVHPDDPR